MFLRLALAPPWPLPFSPPPSRSHPGPKARRKHRPRRRPSPMPPSPHPPRRRRLRRHSRRSVRRGHDTDRKADRVSQRHRHLGQRLRDDHQLASRRSKPTSARKGSRSTAADDDLHRDRRRRLSVPGGHPDRRAAEELRPRARSRSAIRRKGTRSNSSIADRMTAWTTPTRRSPTISTTKARSQGHVHRAIFDRSADDQRRSSRRQRLCA